MELIQLSLAGMYFLLPAYFANMAPVIAKRISLLHSWKTPIDRGVNFFDNKPIFGKNKTYRGFLFAILTGIATGLFQHLLSGFEFMDFMTLPLVDYSNLNSILLLGGLLGFGAITGDLVKSFFKRRLKFKAGASFVPLDQTDFVIGALTVCIIFYPHILTWTLVGMILILSFCLHIIVNHISFYLGIRKEKW